MARKKKSVPFHIKHNMREFKLPNGTKFWARNNEDLYEDFNSTAFYLTPTDVDNEFSYDAYLNALEEGTLAPRTPEQWILAKNRLLGSIAY